MRYRTDITKAEASEIRQKYREMGFGSGPTLSRQYAISMKTFSEVIRSKIHPDENEYEMVSLYAAYGSEVETLTEVQKDMMRAVAIQQAKRRGCTQLEIGTELALAENRSEDFSDRTIRRKANTWETVERALAENKKGEK